MGYQGDGRNIAGDILIGLAAGAAATWVMDKATTIMYQRESDDARERENQARGDRTAYEIAAEKTAALGGRELTDEQRSKVGAGIHWTLGTSAGAAYALVRDEIPLDGLSSGLLFGALFWLAMDEAALTLLGLTPPPQEFPWQSHARGLAGHLVFGAVAGSIFDLARAAAQRSDRASARSVGRL